MGNFLKNMVRGVGNLLRGGQNPADNARQYLQPVPDYGKAAYNPFIQQGQEAYAKLNPQYEKLLTNPAGLYNEDVAGYHPSEQYQMMAPYLQEALANANRASGYGGTSADEFAQGDLVRQLLSQDLGTYMENVRGNRALGLQGYETATGRGFQGAGSLADYLGNAAGNRANLEYSGKQQQNANKSQLFGDIIKAISGGYGAYAGAKKPGDMTGSATGVPPGTDLSSINTRLPGFGGNISPGVGYDRGRGRGY
jgi:hypothetical protein